MAKAIRNKSKEGDILTLSTLVGMNNDMVESIADNLGMMVMSDERETRELLADILVDQLVTFGINLQLQGLLSDPEELFVRAFGAHLASKVEVFEEES